MVDASVDGALGRSVPPGGCLAARSVPPLAAVHPPLPRRARTGAGRREPGERLHGLQGSFPPPTSQASAAGANVRRTPDGPTERTGRGDPAELIDDTADVDVDHGGGFVGGD